MERIEALFCGDTPQRLDVYVAEIAGLSRSHAAKIIESGEVCVNGKAAVKNLKLKDGDAVSVGIPKAEEYKVTAQNIPLDILFEDSELLVVNKPRGMVVHPAAGNFDGTLVNALMYHCGESLSGINGVMRPGILHRIDKDTSGLLIVAKNDFSHNFLASQIAEHTCNRIYEAVVYGKLKSDSGTVDAPIGRHPVKRKQMAVVAGGKSAVTHYEAEERFERFTRVRLRLETGRTHQIRVHMSYIGHPIAGDGVYGPKKVIKELSGQCLHAAQIGFIHPKTLEYMEFKAELPKYFTDFTEGCRNGRF